MKKAFWKSKTFWVNLIAAIGLVYQGVTGDILVIPIEQQALILAGLNLILRRITQEPITW